MKKLTILLSLLSVCLYGRAEGTLQVVSFGTTAGVVSDDAAYFEIEMTTPEPIWGLQFEMLLPEGMTLDETYDPFELTEDCWPNTTGRKGNITYDHDISYQKHSDGWIAVLVYAPSSAAARTKATEGIALKAYYLTDAQMEPGTYAIQIRQAKLAVTTEKSYIPAESSTPIFINGTEPVEIPYTLTSAGWGTLMLPFDAAIPAGLTAYSCYELKEDELVLTQATTLKASTPYLLTGKVGEYSFEGVPTIEANVCSDGVFDGVHTDTERTNGYVLQDGVNGLAFYPINETTPVTVPAGRCYIKATAAGQASSLSFRGATGIRPVYKSDETQAYDVMGRAIDDPSTKGIIICNNKKILK